MRYVGMVIGGILSAIGHVIAFMFKNTFIQVRRYAMDPANKNAIWNMQAISVLTILILCFLWLVGKYQDLFYGVGEPVFYRAVPLLISCFLGHIIYSSPLIFKSKYSKPVIQTFLNSLSVLAAGQIIMHYVEGWQGLTITFILFFGSVALTLFYTLQINIRSTVFYKLSRAAEESTLNINTSSQLKLSKWDGILNGGFATLEKIDLSKKGSLSHLRYYSEECKLELFHTVPTKYRGSELIVLNRGDRAQHQQTIGGTGAGKTLLATTLVTQDVLNDFMGTTILEPKGSFIKRMANFMDRTGRPYRRLDPEYSLTDCLNPFFVPEGEDIEPMIEANVSAFHGYLGPDPEQYFKSRSTQLLRIGIKALKIVLGNDCTYNHLNRLIQPINDDYRAEIMSEFIGRETEVPLLLEYTRNMASGGKLQEHAMQTYSGLYDYLSELTESKYVQRIFCGKSTFNIDDALRNGEVILVNGAYGKLQTLTYTVGRLFLNLLRASTFRRNLTENVRPHQLTVDEIEMFADEEFSTFLEMAREFEVYVNVIHQGNVQLTDVSERLGGMVKQNAVQKFILAGLDNEDAEYYADMIGEDYKIGQSSGTDEMSVTGFKTQLKEEKRYRVMPSEITGLKGYNPETGEPGECLFRGVHNNVRMEPVIGLIYPLPRKLFEPLEESSQPNVEPGNSEMVGSAKERTVLSKSGGPDRSESSKNRLDQIKEKGKRAAKETSSGGEESQTGPNMIRSSAWDSEDDETPKVAQGKVKVVEDETIVKTGTLLASKNRALNDLEEKLAQRADAARNSG
ncbi:Type IV secretory pathway, VirD4 component, TraG/TraD family ATPase [Paenibacillus sp. UNC496MF]|uniref:type IV secretory system conjugative DNA transfer family protein n=1 Tax=Paenibacillus sp. UNC496MF TaxID=1502753 RepID=UPI0008E5789F|nr:type IV secretory system conjugative DNA transfer family protein [Paenibacillus sp. UNC496MF]SFJ77159.1 Type IV secretory pathway, VirD4 component, TraG/TraD family ATPase [Paenibacillus sp. UNC496MF]